MANIAPANFAYVNANGDKGDVQVLSDADITLLNKGLQDIEDLKLAIQKPLPAGTMIPFAGNVVPEGFLVCNGAAVSRTDYANLFAAIGTLYGAGDGSTTFNLPDARDRVLQGASETHSAGSYIAAGLPNITGQIAGIEIFSNPAVVTGAFNIHEAHAQVFGTDHRSVDAFGFIAHDSSSYYGASTKPQVDAISSYILIKI